MCVIQQTSPDLYFTRNKLCTKVTPEGRITLTNDKLKITAAGTTTELKVENPADFTHQLKTILIYIYEQPTKILITNFINGILHSS
jgi:N-hydroxyarylamine O-acetyltransferase